MIEKDGYFPPRDVIFEEIKNASINIWKLFYTDEYGYVSEKLERINYIKNEGADVMFILQMFHPVLRDTLTSRLSAEAKDYIKYYERASENQRSDTKENN